MGQKKAYPVKTASGNKPFNSVSNELIAQFEKLLGADNVLHGNADRFAYSHDETEDYSFMPEAVLKPENTAQVSEIMRLCHEHYIPVTPRGGGTGLSGGALPTHGGVVVSMEKFNTIIEIDTMNLQATAEPGVITEVFQNAVKEKGLFYPPDPASRGTCFLGGNLAECSGGPKAVKYGVTRDYVINTEVVLPTGEVIMTGANVVKNSTGYNLTQLMVGSEGTLGIITKIVFKLRPYPKKNVVLLAPFTSSEEACRAIASVFMAGINPSGMEFMEREAIEQTMRYLREKMHTKVIVDFPENIKAHLIIELDGNDEEVLMRDAETVLEVLESFDTGEILFADTERRKEELWKLRVNISPAVNAYTLTKAEDIVVPRSELPKLIAGIKEIGDEYGFKSVCFGHAGDGNLHMNVLKNDISDEAWDTTVNEGIAKIFELTVSLGGTLSGEHGIGIAKRPFMPLAVSETNLRLMRGIKAAFDPKGILNPEKIF